jgi:predicted transcriptional regulator
MDKVTETMLLSALKSLNHPDRFKIVKKLKEANELSYSEIRNLFGEEYNDGYLCQHLKNLLHARIIIKNKRRTIGMGNKVKTSFYKLSDFGELVLSHLLKIAIP